MKAIARLLLLTLVLILLAGCGEVTSTPWPTTPTGTATPALSVPTQTAVSPAMATATPRPATPAPTATPSPLPATATPTATPEPEGRLLSVLTERDLALPGGNLYNPSYAMAGRTGETLYVVGSAIPDRGGSVLGVVDARVGQLLRVIPLPGYSSGAMAEGKDLLYVAHADDAWQPHIMVLRRSDDQVMANVQLEGSSLPYALALDTVSGRLFVALPTRLEVRNARDLSLLDTVDQGPQGPISQMAFDATRQRLYVASSQEVRAYNTALWTMLWQRDLPDVRDLLLDASGQRLYVRTETYRAAGPPVNALRILSWQSGADMAEPDERVASGYWQLAAAGDGRLYLLTTDDGGAYLIALDPDTRERQQTRLPSGYYSELVYEPQMARIAVLDYDDHLLRQYDARTLEPAGIVPLGIALRDIQLAGDRLYVNDSAGRVHALRRDDHAPLGQVIAGRGAPMLVDEARQRLYVPVETGGDEIAVVDLAEMAVTDILTGGNRLALDDVHGRLFVGQETSVYQPNEGAVRVLDARTLARLRTLPQPGIPAYNPLRDEIYVVDETVYVYDGQTYAAKPDLTPDLSDPPFRGCNGCLYARGVYIYPAEDLLVVDVSVHVAGAGAGTYPSPRFLSLRTLEPTTWPAAGSWTCGNRFTLQSPTDGMLYTTISYSRYVSYQNLVARRAGSEEVAGWLDGVNAALVIPQTRVIYTSRGDELYLALDMDTWQPLGHIPFYCVHTLDLARQRLYATDRSALIVLRDRGGQPLPAPPARPLDKLPAVEQILVSPNYAADQTLWVAGGGSLARSTDGGQTWMRLEGGLPTLQVHLLSYALAVSPNYAQDHTLFAAISGGDSVGYGVYRSTDGGDHWQPMWDGLSHLRVTGVVLSPRYAQDGTLLAHTAYHRLTPPMDSGEAMFKSTDRGAHWVLVATRSYSDSSTPLLQRAAALLDSPAPLVQLTRHNYGEVVRTTDGGRTWQTVLLVPEGQFIQQVVAVPELAESRTAYALLGKALYRTTDLGETWQIAVDPRLTDRPEWALEWRQLAVAPARGGHILLLGDGQGNLLKVHPEEIGWQRVEVPVPAPTPTATPSPTEAPPRVVPTMPPSPTPCSQAMGPAFAPVAAPAQAFLGCPAGGAEGGHAATQPFQQGRMFWREDQRVIYVLTADGRWFETADMWDESQPPYDASLTPPEGLIQPVRGFGKVWREQLGGPSAAIGWATGPEMGYEASWQYMASGLLLTDDEGRVYALRGDGTWRLLTP